MIKVRISKELIEDGLATGASHRKLKITDGIPPFSKLVDACFDGEELTLMFAETEKVKEKVITVTTSE